MTHVDTRQGRRWTDRMLGIPQNAVRHQTRGGTAATVYNVPLSRDTVGDYRQYGRKDCSGKRRKKKEVTLQKPGKRTANFRPNCWRMAFAHADSANTTGQRMEALCFWAPQRGDNLPRSIWRQFAA